MRLIFSIVFFVCVCVCVVHSQSFRSLITRVVCVYRHLKSISCAPISCLEHRIAPIIDPLRCISIEYQMAANKKSKEKKIGKQRFENENGDINAYKTCLESSVLACIWSVKWPQPHIRIYIFLSFIFAFRFCFGESILRGSLVQMFAVDIIMVRTRSCTRFCFCSKMFEKTRSIRTSGTNLKEQWAQKGV